VTALNRIFRIGLGLKGADGVLELAGGVLLLVVSPSQMSSAARLLTLHELGEDPHDVIATSLVRFADSLTVSVSLFAALYLLLHGIVKVVLVWAVLRNTLWAYPWMIAFLLAFVTYQLYQIALSFSIWLVLLTVFDLFIAWLTWREYQSHRALSARRGA